MASKTGSIKRLFWPQTSIFGEKRTKFSTENRLQWALSRVNYP